MHAVRLAARSLRLSCVKRAFVTNSRSGVYVHGVSTSSGPPTSRLYAVARTVCPASLRQCGVGMEEPAGGGAEASGDHAPQADISKDAAAESVRPRYMTPGIDVFADGTRPGDAGLVPVAGRVKARDPSDFVVNEIDTRGAVVVLRDTTTVPPQPKREAPPVPHKPAASAAPAAPPVPGAESVSTASSARGGEDATAAEANAPRMRLTKEWLCEAVGAETFAALEAFANATQPRERGAISSTAATAGGEHDAAPAPASESEAAERTGVDVAPPDAGSVAVQFTRAALDRDGFKPHAHAVIKYLWPWLTTRSKMEGDTWTVTASVDRRFDELAQLLSLEDLTALQRFDAWNVAARSREGMVLPRSVELTSAVGRKQRTVVHQAIATRFPHFSTRTVGGEPRGAGKRARTGWRSSSGRAGTASAPPTEQRISIVLKPGKGRGRGRGRGRGGRGGKRGRDRDGGKAAKQLHLRFVLEKEGVETLDAFVRLGRLVHMPSTAFGYAGTKDKRAVTTQQCSVRGVAAAALLRANAQAHGLRVGDLEWGTEVRLGQLLGNRFTVTVRADGVTAAEGGFTAADAPLDLLQRRVQQVQAAGFVNYFGEQRVGRGTAAPNQPDIGLAICQGDWAAAANMQLGPRYTTDEHGNVTGRLREVYASSAAAVAAAAAADDESVATSGGRGNKWAQLEKARANWIATHDAASTLSLLPSSVARREEYLLKGLCRFGMRNARRAVESIPYMSRTMYVRAYQSSVWNSMATERVKAFGSAVAVGDLVVQVHACPVCARNTAGGTDVAATEAGAAPEAGAGAGAGAGTSTGAGGPKCELPGHAALARLDAARAGRVKLVQTEAEAALYSVLDVVLPLHGFSVLYPTNAIGQRYRARFEADGVPFLAAQVEAKLAAAAAARARGPAGSAATGTAGATAAAGATTTGATSRQPQAPAREANQRGSYRLLIATPWDASVQLTTDSGTNDGDDGLQRVAGVSSSAATASTSGGSAPDAVTVPAAVGPGLGVDAGRARAANLAFSLPASSFATVCVREILRSNV